MFTRLHLLLLSLSLLLTACMTTTPIEVVEPNNSSLDYVYEARETILSADDRQISYYLDRPKDIKVPIFVVIDGSGCSGQMRESFKTLFRPDLNTSRPYARLAVEKPGVSPDAGPNAPCSEEFLRDYSMTNRVLDHIRVFQHLRYHADWWNGELYVWGWSDGGDIATQLVAYYPLVTRAVLGAMGGGYTMSEHFIDFWVCPKEMPEKEREGCINELEAHFTAMNDNPTWKKTWSGPSNSWKAWSTRLNTRLSNLLKDNATPILIVQGANDFDATPTQSARKLIDELRESDNRNYAYWEIKNMEHSWSSLPAAQARTLENAMLTWLLTGVESAQITPLLVTY